MFNAIAHSAVKIDARININSTSDPTLMIPTAFLCLKEGELYRTSVRHLTSLVQGAVHPQLTAGMSNLRLSTPCIASAKFSECSLINLKRFVPLLLWNIKLSSVKSSCQDQRTQTISETAEILQTTEPICLFFLRGSLLCPR